MPTIHLTLPAGGVSATLVVKGCPARTRITQDALNLAALYKELAERMQRVLSDLIASGSTHDDNPNHDPASGQFAAQGGSGKKAKPAKRVGKQWTPEDETNRSGHLNRSSLSHGDWAEGIGGLQHAVKAAMPKKQPGQRFTEHKDAVRAWGKRLPIKKVKASTLLATQWNVHQESDGQREYKAPLFDGIGGDHPVVAMLPDGSMHILDGHHRVDAAAKIGAEVEVKVVPVEGPVNPYIKKTHDEKGAGNPYHEPAGSGKGGQFASGPGGPKPDTVKATSGKAAVHELLSSGHPFTKKELADITGIKPELVQTYLFMLKSPKYTGGKDVLNIKKLPNGAFQVVMPDGTPAPGLGGAEPPKAPPEVVKPVEPIPPEVKPEVKPEPPPKPAPKVEPYVPATLEQIESRFAKYKLAKLRKHFKDNYGLDVANDISEEESQRIVEISKQFDEYWRKAPQEQGAWTPEMSALVNERDALLRRESRSPSRHLRDHIRVNLESDTEAAKQQRRMLGHVDETLKALTSEGWDIKAALAGVDVAFSAGAPKQSLGHAWQGKHGKMGRFSLNPEKVVGTEERRKNADSRQMRGLPKWTNGHGQVGHAAVRSTVTHELAHALGMLKSKKSPEHLASILDEAIKSRYRSESFSSKVGDIERQAWIKKNLGAYAATNIRETDAELCATVMDPKYKRGTLPKILEDHVDALFKRKAP